MALPGPAAGKAPVATEEQVTCQFCKYLLQGALLGDCRVTRWIGSGAFGDVYEAEQMPPLSRRVAIKVMSLDRVADGKSAEFFAREVRTIAALDHPNIMPVLRVGTLEDGRSYLVMKYAAHGSLQKYCQMTPQHLSILPTEVPVNAAVAPAPAGAQDIDPAETISIEDGPGKSEQHEGDGGSEPAGDKQASSGQLSISGHETASAGESPAGEEAGPGDTKITAAATPPEASILTPQQLLPYVESAAVALQYAHDHNLIHLDVKPANLLLDSEGRLLLADFGVSAVLDGLTHASLHCYVGTPVYTAPEQWLEQPRAASDQYALAVTCYQLLTGRVPFTGNLYSIMHGHLQTPPPALREFNPLVPPQVEAVILRALAKDPAERYRDMLTFARAYRTALEEAAGAQTDAQGQKPAAELGAQDLAGLATLHHVSLEARPAGDIRERAGEIAARKFSQTAAIRDEVAPAEVQPRPAQVTKPAKKRRVRIALLALIILVLAASGALGLMRITNPCLLGMCPGMKVSTNEVDITNSDSQAVKITNTGTADLQWRIALQGSAPWLSYSPARGTLSPGKTTTFSITTNAANMPNGTNTALLQVIGQGVNPQTILVKLAVQTGLSQVGVKVSGKSFSYDQKGLHPSAQSITITNKSGQVFSWSLEYSRNTWLQVTPDNDTLQNGASETLAVTANVQNLLPNTYVATVTIFGKLENQAEPGFLASFEFRLEVQQPAQTVTPTTTTTPGPVFPSFSAQQPPSTGAPTILRSQHSMVWDSQDDLIFVFGGVDDQGHLLNDLWSYSPASGQWSELSVYNSSAGNCPDSNVPAPRMNAAMVWDNLDQQILLYGGLSASNHYLGDLWSYSPGAKSWTALACSGNAPGPRASNAVWNGSAMLLLGGMNKNGLLADFWSYTPGSNGGAWQRLPDSPVGPRAYQTLVWDSTGNQLYVFGGIDASGAQHGDLNVYSANGGWSPITPKSASNPLPRQQGMGAWDSKDNVLLLMGGWNDSAQGTPYWGLWAFDPKQEAWALLTPLNSANTNIIPGRTAAVMVWDAKDQAAYIYAGAGNGKTGSSLDDLWMVTSS